MEQASDAFERLLGRDGYARCPEHGVDHTGKTARAIVLNCALASDDPDDRYIDRAVRVARAVTGRLGQDDAAGGAWVFFPSRPHYMSALLVDCGECVDALATLLEVAGDRLPDIDRARIEEAIRLCAETYLAPTAPGAPVVSERLCSALGLASAAAALDEHGWIDTVRETVAGALGEMRPDGSFPAVGDTAVTDHGRILAFARCALTRIGDRESHAEALQRGVDFLIDILRPDGVKPPALDGQRWCWDADAEAGSAPYDAYALATDGRPAALRLAGIVAARSAQAVGPDGLVDACPTGATAISRVAHTADLAWLARAHAAAELDDLPTNPPPPKPAPPIHRADAGVVRLQARRACAILRVRKKPANGLVGARIGGGGLVYVGDAERGWANALAPVCEPWMPEGTWFLSSAAQAAPAPPRRRRVVSPAPRADALARRPPPICPADALSLPWAARVGGRRPIRLDPRARRRGDPGRRRRADRFMPGARRRPAASSPAHRSPLSLERRPLAGRRRGERRAADHGTYLPLPGGH